MAEPPPDSRPPKAPDPGRDGCLLALVAAAFGALAWAAGYFCAEAPATPAEFARQDEVWIFRAVCGIAALVIGLWGLTKLQQGGEP